MLRPGELSVQSTFGRVLVHHEEAGCIGGGDVVVLDVDAVGSVDEEQVAGVGDRATAHVVLRDAQLLHHVEDPDDVGFVVGRDWFVRVGAVVLAVVETFGVEAADFAAAGDEPEPVALDQRRGADALLRPVVDAAGRQLLAASAARETCRP